MNSKTYICDDTVRYEEMPSTYPFIEAYFKITNPNHGNIIVVPDGMTEVQFFYGPQQKNSQVLLAGTTLIGKKRIFPVLDTVFGVRFQPGVIPELFHNNVLDVVNSAIIISDIEPFHQILEQIQQSNDFIEQIQCFERFFVTNIAKCNPITEFLLSQVNTGHSLESVDRLIAETGYSHVHVNRVFKADMGFSLKFYLDTLRMQHVIHCLSERRIQDLQRFSEHMGFYDQSHFTKCFKKYTTYTPKKFVIK